MKCRMIELRNRGVDLPKRQLREYRGEPGNLLVMDIRDDGVATSIKVAQFASTDLSNWTRRLYEPRLVWMNEGRFVIAGVERVQVDGSLIHYAQAWLCKIELPSQQDSDRDYRR